MASPPPLKPPTNTRTRSNHQLSLFERDSHTNPPKYRCPRCSTRTCSLPCTRRHKTWSQCSGVRDPAAYVRRSDLATPAAFDRDFNFITAIERRLERAERDVENRGIPLSVPVSVDRGDSHEDVDGAGHKRKRPPLHSQQHLAKGEAGFLRGAERAGVTVVRAPRGMTRNRQNASRWHPKHKCLSWTVEWIAPDGQKTLANCLETSTLAEAYDRVYPLPKEEKQKQLDSAAAAAAAAADETDPVPDPPTTSTASADEKQDQQDQPAAPEEEITPHRTVYFYLHRPRTTTKQPVLVPLPPSTKLTSALRGRTVLEFPTVYALPRSPGEILSAPDSTFLLEEVYLRSHPAPMEGDDGDDDLEDDDGDGDADEGDVATVDESRVLEVLRQDLMGTGGSGGGATTAAVGQQS
ncbi:hypothetical protein VTN02DRAFT_5751 [Thermoascus thermophilus]